MLLSASDDKTVRVWDLATGRCTKTLEAHGHFVTTMAWGRARVSGGSGGTEANGDVGGERSVNVLATGSVDQTVKVSPSLILWGGGEGDRDAHSIWGFRLQVWTP